MLSDLEIYYEDKYNLLCGVDEAGRGPLAGDVFAAAVILPKHHTIDGIKDSKKLSEKQREYLFDVITDGAIDFSIARASHTEIDDLNILNATFLAMKRAVGNLKVVPNVLLVDGNADPRIDNFPTQCIIKGDNLISSISAASILAKVSRDRYMIELSKKYPEYGFAKHKGYGTKLHYEAISKHGICPIHRKSFLKKILDT
jgi:ribonuclease HII